MPEFLLEVPGHLGLTVVLGPPEGGRAVVRVAQVRVRSELDEKAHHREVPDPRGVMEGRRRQADSDAVVPRDSGDLEAELGHQPHAVELSRFDCALEQLHAAVEPERARQAGVLLQEGQRLRASPRYDGRGERIARVEDDLPRTVGAEIVRDPGVAGEDGGLIGRPAVAQAGHVHIGAVLDEQPHAPGKIPARRGPELLDEKPGRARQSIGEAAIPGTAPVSAEPVLEEQAKVAVVFAEVPVVERLAVVRIRARIEEQARELVAAGMRRLTRSPLALAEGARERREGRQVSLPEEAGVRIGSAFEQETRDLECGSLRGLSKTRVARIEKGLPAERAASCARELRLSLQHRARRRDVPGRGRREDARGADRGLGLDHRLGLRQVRSLPAPVVETRQTHERIGRGVRGVLDVGRRIESKRRDGLDVALELRPARKPVGSREHQLRAAQGERRGGGLPFRVELADSRQSLGGGRLGLPRADPSPGDGDSPETGFREAVRPARRPPPRTLRGAGMQARGPQSGEEDVVRE